MSCDDSSSDDSFFSAVSDVECLPRGERTVVCKGLAEKSSTKLTPTGSDVFPVCHR